MLFSNFIAIVVIAFALSLDAFVVSLASGITIKILKLKHALRISLMFGLFQAMMPVLGWLIGAVFSHHLKNLENFVAAGIFFIIGGKMILEGVFIKEEKNHDYTSLKVIFLFAVATSIDAFAVGVSFSLFNVNILEPVLIIGFITFATSFLGVYLGNATGRIFGDRIGIAGGVVLVLLGAKFLLEALG